mmetsp:Transcript_60719/g.110729  ORF Transcript_60719/g.110729 Transcript_60719/m.110729 type:complete len:155 (+) Transcript_60719:200-664(+)
MCKSHQYAYKLDATLTTVQIGTFPAVKLKATTVIDMQYLNPFATCFIAKESEKPRTHCISRIQKGRSERTILIALYVSLSVEQLSLLEDLFPSKISPVMYKQVVNCMSAKIFGMEVRMSAMKVREKNASEKGESKTIHTALSKENLWCRPFHSD